MTGTMAPAPLGNMGRSVDVVSREEVAQLPIANANDLLRLLSSVEVRARGPFGVQADFSIRGAGFGQALVMVDGVRLNDAQSGHHNADIPVPLDAIERDRGAARRGIVAARRGCVRRHHQHHHEARRAAPVVRSRGRQLGSVRSRPRAPAFSSASASATPRSRTRFMDRSADRRAS